MTQRIYWRVDCEEKCKLRRSTNLKLEMCKAVRKVFDSISRNETRSQSVVKLYHRDSALINQGKRGGPPMKIWGPQQFGVVEAGKL
jgi:hypothetical protein